MKWFVALFVFASLLLAASGASALNLQGQGGASGNFNPQSSPNYILQPIGISGTTGGAFSLNQSGESSFSRQSIMSEADSSNTSKSSVWPIIVYFALGLIAVIFGYLAFTRIKRH